MKRIEAELKAHKQDQKQNVSVTLAITHSDEFIHGLYGKNETKNAKTYKLKHTLFNSISHSSAMTTEMNIVPEIFSVRCVYISNSMRVCLRDK